MEVFNYTPSTIRGKKLPWDDLSIMALGDIQAGSETCDLQRLARHIKWGLDHDAYFFGMGDYTDFLSPSNRARLKAAALYDTAQKLIDEWHDKHLNDLKDVLAPTRGRWIGLLEGHHYHEFSDGGTSDTKLAEWLGAPFLGTSAIMRLQFMKDTKTQVTAHVWAHHGEGSGATLASPFNKLEKISGAIDADVFLMGHYHRAGVVLSDKLYVAGGAEPKLRHRTRALVATGSFLRGYQQGSRVSGRPGGHYVEKGLMTPTALGNVLVTLRPKKLETHNTIDLSCTTVSI